MKGLKCDVCGDEADPFTPEENLCYRCTQDQLNSDKINRMANDTEENHADADDILLDILNNYGYDKTIKAFIELDKWYA